MADTDGPAGATMGTFGFTDLRLDGVKTQNTERRKTKREPTMSALPEDAALDQAKLDQRTGSAHLRRPPPRRSPRPSISSSSGDFADAVKAHVDNPWVDVPGQRKSEAVKEDDLVNLITEIKNGAGAAAAEQEVQTSILGALGAAPAAAEQTVETSILGALEKRHRGGEHVYTKIGIRGILISVNPYDGRIATYCTIAPKRAPRSLARALVRSSLASSATQRCMRLSPRARALRALSLSPSLGAADGLEKMRAYYLAAAAGSSEEQKLAPHIFAIATDAFRRCVGQQELTPAPQTIVLTGESGSGKTENAKQVFAYLSAVMASRIASLGGMAVGGVDSRVAKGVDEIVMRLKTANYVLEAFGNVRG